MKTKLKDILLYSFAAIGVCSLFIAASNSPQQTTSTVPESHVWELKFADTQAMNWAVPYLFNKKTGEVRKYNNRPIDYDKKSRAFNTDYQTTWTD